MTKITAPKARVAFPKLHKPATVFGITEYRADGTSREVAVLSEDEYVELMRAMQWPEDLPAFDRLHTPVYFSLPA